MLQVLIFTWAMAAQGAAPPPERPSPAPDLVSAYTSGLAAQCGVSNEGAASPPVDRVDLTGDGLPEVVVDANRFPCPKRPEVFREHAQVVTLFRGEPDGRAFPVFQRAAYGTRIQRADGRVTLWITLSGADCGQQDAKSRCERQVIWSPRAARFELSPLARETSQGR